MIINWQNVFLSTKARSTDSSYFTKYNYSYKLYALNKYYVELMTVFFSSMYIYIYCPDHKLSLKSRVWIDKLCLWLSKHSNSHTITYKYYLHLSIFTYYIAHSTLINICPFSLCHFAFLYTHTLSSMHITTLCIVIIVIQRPT